MQEVKNPISFADLPDYGEDVPPDVDACLSFVIGALRRVGLTRVLVAEHTPPSAPLRVVRVLAPGLEMYNSLVPRMGRRLVSFRDRLAARPAVRPVASAASGE